MLSGALDTALAAHFRRAGSLRVDTPALTSNACEGGTEPFSVKAAGDAAPPHTFFGGPAYLTTSAQMHLEVAAQALGELSSYFF